MSVISGNIIGRTQTLTLYVEGAYKVGTPSWDGNCGAMYCRAGAPCAACQQPRALA